MIKRAPNAGEIQRKLKAKPIGGILGPSGPGRGGPADVAPCLEVMG
jgi:hypothetical protein